MWQHLPKSVWCPFAWPSRTKVIAVISGLGGAASRWRLVRVEVETSACGAGSVILREAPSISAVPQMVVGCLVWILIFPEYFFVRRLGQGYEDQVFDVLDHDDHQSLNIVGELSKLQEKAAEVKVRLIHHWNLPQEHYRVDVGQRSGRSPRRKREAITVSYLRTSTRKINSLLL